MFIVNHFAKQLCFVVLDEVSDYICWVFLCDREAIVMKVYVHEIQPNVNIKCEHKGSPT